MDVGAKHSLTALAHDPAASTELLTDLRRGLHQVAMRDFLHPRRHV